MRVTARLSSNSNSSFVSDFLTNNFGIMKWLTKLPLVRPFYFSDRYGRAFECPQLANDLFTTGRFDKGCINLNRTSELCQLRCQRLWGQALAVRFSISFG